MNKPEDVAYGDHDTQQKSAQFEADAAAVKQAAATFRRLDITRTADGSEKAGSRE